MRTKTVWALVAVNALLLASLIFHNGFVRSAGAQLTRGGRPSEYIMIPGEVQGGNGGLIFIVDTRNGWLTARTLQNNKITDMPPIDLNRIFKAIAK